VPGAVWPQAQSAPSRRNLDKAGVGLAPTYYLLSTTYSLNLHWLMNQPLVDSHCHLADPEFDPDRDQVIGRAREAGVRYLLLVGTGTTYKEISAVLPIAEQNEGACAAAGIHPHEARHFLASDLGELRQFASHPRFLALGEIGLDYHYDHSPRDAQAEILIRQLELARELKLPIVIHCRDAWPDLRAIVKEHWRSTGLEGVLHCFTGSREDAFDLMDCGFFVSFAGNLTFKNAGGLRETARQIPPDKLLAETDSPYLAPVPYRGKRNEPAYVREVVRALAALRNIGEGEMAMQILQNFWRLFRLSIS
jgi:TatD DNase family protein